MTVPPYSLLFTAFGFTLAVLFALVLYYNGRRRAWKPQRRKEKIYRCANCGRIYADRRNVPLSSCPGCRKLNEAVRR